MKKKRNNFTDEDALQFNLLHNKQKLSLRKIGEIYSTSHGVIKNTLVKYDYSYNQRQYALNEDYFKDISDPKKQYFLGWLYSDGCLFSYEKRYHGFSIKVQKRDEYILDYLKHLIESTAQIQSEYIEGREYRKLKIGSIKVFNDLLRSGLTPRKTHILQYPEEIITEPRAFILGVFEGDGSISFKKKCGTPVFSITGTEDMVKHIKHIFELEIGLNEVSIKKQKNSYVLSYQGSNVVTKIGEWLYSWNPLVCLKRKKNLFKKILKIPRYGKCLVIFKCPSCGGTGSFEKRSISQLKKYTFKSKFCSLSCSAQFSRKYQLNNKRLTPEMELALNNNILSFEKEYKYKEGTIK